MELSRCKTGHNNRDENTWMQKEMMLCVEILGSKAEYSTTSMDIMSHMD